MSDPTRAVSDDEIAWLAEALSKSWLGLAQPLNHYTREAICIALRELQQRRLTPAPEAQEPCRLRNFMDDGGPDCVTHDMRCDWVECTGWRCPTSGQIVKAEAPAQDQPGAQEVAPSVDVEAMARRLASYAREVVMVEAGKVNLLRNGADRPVTPAMFTAFEAAVDARVAEVLAREFEIAALQRAQPPAEPPAPTMANIPIRLDATMPVTRIGLEGPHSCGWVDVEPPPVAVIQEPQDEEPR